MQKVNLEHKLSLFTERWSPKIVGELNGQHVKLAKLEGEFVWHQHDNEDEMFLVIEGNLIMAFRNRAVELSAGEFIIIPRGVEHKPIAKNPVSVLLFEPQTTVNTGEVINEFTKEKLEWI